MEPTSSTINIQALRTFCSQNDLAYTLLDHYYKHQSGNRFLPFPSALNILKEGQKHCGTHEVYELFAEFERFKCGSMTGNLKRCNFFWYIEPFQIAEALNTGEEKMVIRNVKKTTKNILPVESLFRRKPAEAVSKQPEPSSQFQPQGAPYYGNQSQPQGAPYYGNQSQPQGAPYYGNQSPHGQQTYTNASAPYRAQPLTASQASETQQPATAPTAHGYAQREPAATQSTPAQVKAKEGAPSGQNSVVARPDGTKRVLHRPNRATEPPHDEEKRGRPGRKRSALSPWVSRFADQLGSEGLSRSTLTNYTLDVRKFESWLLTVCKLDFPEVTEEHIKLYYNTLTVDEGRAPSTVNRRFQTLKKFFGWMHRNGYIKTNPTYYI